MIEADRIAAVLLAAGRSERFGSDKLLARVRDEPVAVMAAKTLVAVGPGRLIAVCRAGSEVAAILSDLGFEIIVNAEPARGLSSSLALGIERADLSGADAALVTLGDMPFVGPEHIKSLLAAFDPAKASIVASGRDGTAMPPALFARSHFGALRTIEGDRGARALLAGALLVAGDPLELADIDRPEDLR